MARMRGTFLTCLSILATACSPPSTGNSSEQKEPPIANGRSAFRPCAACHALAPPDSAAGKMRLVGPNLFGVYGRRAAALETYAYSPALREAGLVWDEATLDAYIQNPRAVVPGTRMVYQGEPDAAQRAAIIALLRSDGAP